MFNRCIEAGAVLLALARWQDVQQDVHPGLVTISVDREYEIPYGLLYARTPSPDVLRFVEAVKHLVNP